MNEGALRPEARPPQTFVNQLVVKLDVSTGHKNAPIVYKIDWIGVSVKTFLTFDAFMVILYTN